MDTVVQKCKDVLQDHYQDRLCHIILYGSTAREDAVEDSDIDLLVLLKKPFDYFEELGMITDLLYPLQLESAKLISARPADVDEFERGQIQLYLNAKREGIIA